MESLITRYIIVAAYGLPLNVSKLGDSNDIICICVLSTYSLFLSNFRKMYSNKMFSLLTTAPFQCQLLIK